MTSESRVRVRYAETDQMGVVYHANYLVWFEVGRTGLLRSLGLDYKSMETQDHCHIAVIEATARYRLPARYDDELIVRTRIAQLRRSILAFEYKIHREADEALLCDGSTTHLVVGRDLKRAPMPARFAQALSLAYEAATGDNAADAAALAARGQPTPAST